MLAGLRRKRLRARQDRDAFEHPFGLLAQIDSEIEQGLQNGELGDELQRARGALQKIQIMIDQERKNR
jgi:hypothetical protein